MSDVVRIEVSRAGALAIRDGLRFAEEGDRGEAWRAVREALGDATRQEMGGVTDAMRGTPVGVPGGMPWTALAEARFQGILTPSAGRQDGQPPVAGPGADLPSERRLAKLAGPLLPRDPTYTCPTHGEIGQKVLEITGLDRSGAWCGECIAEALGRAGVQRAVRRP